jgi:hypothetical protein
MSSLKKLLSPWGIALGLLLVFLAWQGYGYWKDRGLEQALERDPAFASPELKLDFSKKIQYDPLSFVGRGAHAGLWTWTPKGLELTPEGGKYFRMDGDQIVSQAPAGTRRLTRIQLQSSTAAGTQLDFFYEWVELSPAAEALLKPAPRKGEEYLARAVLERTGAGWQVKSLETRDFDEPLGRLQDIANGVLR